MSVKGSSRCNSKTGRHRTISGMMRCPVCRRLVADVSRPGAPALVAGIGQVEGLTSYLPQRGTVSAVSQLPFHQGKDLRPGYHNVGQSAFIPRKMDGKLWDGTWLDGVTLNEHEDRLNRIEIGEFGVSLVEHSLHLKNVKLNGRMTVSLGSSSTISGLELLEASKTRVTSQISLGGDASANNIKGDVAVSLLGESRVSFSKVSSIQAMDGVSVFMCDVEDATTVLDRESYSITISKPGQWVHVQDNPDAWRSDRTGEIAQRVPALVTHEIDFVGSPLDDEYDMMRFFRTRATLCKRPMDGSEGKWLHPHNDAAWDFIVGNDGIIRNDLDLNPDSETYKQNALYPKYEVDENVVSIALSLYENP